MMAYVLWVGGAVVAGMIWVLGQWSVRRDGLGAVSVQWLHENRRETPHDG